MNRNAPAPSQADGSTTACAGVRQGGRFVITVSGDLDFAAVQGAPLATVLSSYRSDEPLDVVLDLRAVTFLDSPGLSWLMAVRAAASLANRKVRLRGSSPVVDKVLDMAQLRRYFPPESRSA